MDRSFLVVALSLSALCARPQQLEHAWANRVGGLESGEKLWRIAVDESGNVYAAGGFRGTFTDQGISVTSVGGLDILLVKYAPDGELLWARAAGGPTNDIAFGVESDKDGNVYIVGAYSGLAVFGDTLISNIDPDQVGLPFSFVARYSPSGDLRWVRTVDVELVSSNYPSNIAFGIKLDRTGDLVVAGEYACTRPSQNDSSLSVMSFGGFPFKTCDFDGYAYVYVQKIDTLGNTEWVHSIGGANGLGTLQSLAFDSQNNVWIGGNCVVWNDFVSGPVLLPDLNQIAGVSGLVYQLSPQGEPLSGFRVNSTDQSNVEDLLVAANGEVFLSGWYRGSLNGSPPASGYDGFFMRTSADGTPIWTNRLVGVSDDFFSGIATTTEPNEVVGGAYYFFQADFAGTTLAQSSGNNSALIRMDTLGAVLEVLQPEVLSGYSLIADVQSDIFGNFFLCGDVGGDVVFTNDTVSCASQDMYVAKISPAVSTSVSEPTAGEWMLFPNPAADRAQLVFPSGSGRAQVIILRDVMGRELRRIRPTGDRVDLDLFGLATGTYLVEVTQNDRRDARRLMVVQQ